MPARIPGPLLVVVLLLAQPKAAFGQFSVEDAARAALPLLEQQANAALPSSMDFMGAWTDVGGPWAILYRIDRDPLRLSLSGTTLTASVRLYYKVQGGRRTSKPWPLKGQIIVRVGSCGIGEAPRIVDVQITSTFDIQHGGTPTVRTTISSLLFPNDCRATAFNIDVTPQIRATLQSRLDDVCRKWDTTLMNALAAAARQPR